MRASEENVRDWLFGNVPGSANSSQHEITFIYKLEGKQEYYDSPPHVVLDLPKSVEITAHPPEPSYDHARAEVHR